MHIISLGYSREQGNPNFPDVILVILNGLTYPAIKHQFSASLLGVSETFADNQNLLRANKPSGLNITGWESISGRMVCHLWSKSHVIMECLGDQADIVVKVNWKEMRADGASLIE